MSDVQRPRLRALARDIHQLFEGPQRRAFLERHIAEALDATKASLRGPTDWQLRRQRHFEQTAMDDASLRDVHQERPDMRWELYERVIRASELSSLDERLRAPKFLRLRPDAEAADPDPDAEAADPDPDADVADPDPDAEAADLRITAWAPVEFLTVHDPTPKYPLPPENIGRDYRLCESCTALAAIHDVCGGGQPFVPVAHELFKRGAWWHLTWRVKTSALDGWVDDLRVQILPQVAAALPSLSHERRDGEPVEGPTAQRAEAIKKRRGRRKADYETVQREAQLVAEWERARESGVYKGDFAKDHGMTLDDFEKLLTRVRKRKKRAD